MTVETCQFKKKSEYDSDIYLLEFLLSGLG